MKTVMTIVAVVCACRIVLAADEFQKPYSAPCTERENVFEFTEKPAVKMLGSDKYEITFAVKGNCDVTVGVIDPSTSSGQGEKGVVVRHLASGVLGANAPAPFQKNSLKQTIYWNGKDDLDVYHKEPGKLKVRVMLGLKPEFDKLLLGKSPKNFSPWIWGIAVGPDGAYVFAKKSGDAAGPGGDGHVTLRKFDHDGGYVQSLVPPPANLPQEKLGGLGFVEYEPGLRASHGVPVNGIINDYGFFLVTADVWNVVLCQPFLLGQTLHFFGRGAIHNQPTSFLHRVNTDGSTDAQEISMPLGGLGELPLGISSRMTASPDGKWLYLVTGRNLRTGYNFGTVVWRAPLAGGEPAKAFIGDPKAPGSDNGHFMSLGGLDCDAAGRLYVCDIGNNRIQIFSAEGKHLKTVSADRPQLVRIHPKTGALYVLHQARLEGKSLDRLTKFTSFEAPVEEWHVDNFGGQALAVDAWTVRTRLWLGAGGNLSIYEEAGEKLNKLVDFDEDAKKAEGGNYIGQWGGSGHIDKVVCDPVRERAYFKTFDSSARYSLFFDLKTGAILFSIPMPGDDVAFDKRGYMHSHWCGGVGRSDPGRPPLPRPWREHERPWPWPRIGFPECPYDYGEEAGDSVGIIKTKDQAGAKTFQDGLGVNMMGDVAEQCNIYWAPKMEAEAEAFAMAGAKGNLVQPESNATNDRFIKEMEKQGESVYFIKREPGIPVLGGTIWTYARNGERQQELAVNTGDLINGVQLDEEGHIYFAVKYNAMRNGRPFLAGKGGVFGAPGDKRGGNILLGTLMKTNGKKTRFVLKNAPVPPDERPKRPADLAGDMWAEGMEWTYAGASPFAYGCSCPTQRLHLDWYKRTFVPEAYRHSFGVLDTAGNLIMHLGKYGNYDSGNGARSKIPVGGDNIAVYLPRFISGTDNYLVFSDWGERLVALKIAYEAEETVGISNQ